MLANPYQQYYLDSMIAPGAEERTLYQCLEITTPQSITFDKFTKIWNSIVSSVEPLRIYFDLQQGVIKQKIDDQKLMVYEFPPESSSEEIFVTLQNKMPISASIPYLFRIGFVSCTAETFRMFFYCHHAIIDAESLRYLFMLFLKQLGLDFPLPIMNTVSQLDMKIQTYLSGLQFQKQAQYWQARLLTGAPYALRPQMVRASLKQDTWIIDGADFHQIKTTVKDNKISCDAFFLTIYGVLLANLLQKETILITKSFSPRILQEFQGCFGAMVNFMIYRISLQTHLSMKEILFKTYKCLFSDYLNAQYPYLLLKNKLSDYDGVENFFFNYHRPSQWGLDNHNHISIHGITIKPLLTGSTGALRDMRLEIFEAKDQFVMRFSVNEARFPEDRYGTFQQPYMDLVSAILQDTTITLHHLLNS